MYRSLRASIGSRRDSSSRSPDGDRRGSYPADDDARHLSRNELDRRASTSSTLSPRTPLISPTFSVPVRSRTDRARNDSEPLGLHVVYDPPGERIADIVLVHGLGGTSRLTWSWKKDLSLFWPEQWLPLEPGMEQVRILTFGYNANFTSPDSDLFNISEFANDLLLQMKVGHDQNVNPLELGEVPIIFVVHSMGGLVVKKAYILGAQDPNYRELVGTVRGMVFLATPHRGSHLAEILNRFLQVSFQSPKQYLNDLQKNSARISDINDQFRHHAERLQLVSFFETKPTTSMMGLGKTIVVEKESAVLGYPNEISSPLNADHHTICKYPSNLDSNYVAVRNVIKSLVEKLRPKALKRRRTAISEESSQPTIDELFHRLEVAERPDDHLATIIQACVPESCDWILSDPGFDAFMRIESPGVRVFHIMAPPGAGKSVLASFLSRYLEDELGLPVQFWFFRFDDKQKRSLRDCLLSLSMQTAACLPEYAQRLVSMAAALSAIKGSDARSVWQKLFANVLDKIRDPGRPVYWILDAVDESENAQTFFKLLETLRHLSFPLRIILTTRPHTVTRHMKNVKRALAPGTVAEKLMTAPERSLELCIEDELQDAPWPEDLKDTITETLLRKSQGNFLWLSLVIKSLENCDTAEELEEILNETPFELVEVYRQIEMTIEKDFKASRKSSDILVVRAILAWVTVSERPLTLDELKEALKPKFSLLNLSHTISRLCRDFVVVDNSGKVYFAHHTAKEYLLKSAGPNLAVDPGAAHRLIFDKCISILTDHRFRMRLKNHEGSTGLLRYCCLFWWHHMAQGDAGVLNERYRHQIAAFFRSNACLAWIETVARTGQLRVLTSTSKALAGYLRRRRWTDMEESPGSQSLLDVEFLSQWAVELVRIVGKFGIHLVRHPSCINNLVPLFSPAESIIGKQFLASNPAAPRVTGISSREWDDSLAKFMLGDNERPLGIQCLDGYFGIRTSKKSVNLYHSTTLQEAQKFNHDESILISVLSQEGDLLMTCGVRTIKVWEVATGKVISAYGNPRGMQAKAATFSRDCSMITICSLGSTLSRQIISEPEDWQHVDWKLREEPALGAGLGTPVCASFSPDGSQLAVCFRGTPVSVWGTEHGNYIGSNNGGSKSGEWKFGHATRLAWNPVSEHIIGINDAYCIFKWYPLDQEPELELEVLAREICCSPDGRLVAIGAPDGSLKIFSFDNFSLLYTMYCNTIVTDLAFSADGRRIYDLRSMFCNVWQPNALIRTAETDEKGSDAASSDYDMSSTAASEASTVMSKPVTAVCVDLASLAFTFGSYGGEVTFAKPSLGGEEDGGLDLVKLKCGFLGITHLETSRDGNLTAIATMDGKVMVRERASGGGSESWQETLFETKSRSPVTQLLFDSGAEHLLVRCERSAEVWSLDSSTPVRCAFMNVDDGHVRSSWVLLPSSPRHFLAITATAVTWYRVTDLFVSQHWDIDTTLVDSVDLTTAPCPTLSQRLFFTHPPSPDETRASVDRVFVTPSQTQLLVQTSKPSLSPGRRDIRFMLLDMRRAPSSGLEGVGASSHAIRAQPLPAPILQEMEIPLGFVADDTPGSQNRCSLAYIDRDFWVRSWRLGAGTGSVSGSVPHGHGTANSKRHFFLPHDWINVDCVVLAQVTADGRFLCPRNGEVAVVHNALRAEWAE